MRIIGGQSTAWSVSRSNRIWTTIRISEPMHWLRLLRIPLLEILPIPKSCTSFDGWRAVEPECLSSTRPIRSSEIPPGIYNLRQRGNHDRTTRRATANCVEGVGFRLRLLSHSPPLAAGLFVVQIVAGKSAAERGSSASDLDPRHMG